MGIACAAADQADLDIEVIDLLSLVPWDASAVIDSVRRTGKLVVVEEAPESGGWGSEIVATVVRDAFGDLTAAPFRITAPNVPVPYSKDLEARYLPGADEVARQVGSYLKTGRVPAPWWREEGIAG
jgi:pyruvate dehydrogenase E1 component beta subunit